MLLAVTLDHPFVEIGITIAAPEVTGVVDAHIHRFDAATRGALVLVLDR